MQGGRLLLQMSHDGTYIGVRSSGTHIDSLQIEQPLNTHPSVHPTMSNPTTHNLLLSTWGIIWCTSPPSLRGPAFMSYLRQFVYAFLASQLLSCIVVVIWHSCALWSVVVHVANRFLTRFFSMRRNLDLRCIPFPINICPSSILRIQMRQPIQHYRPTRLLNLARQEYLVQDRVHLVEVEDEIQLAHIAEEGVQNFDEEVNSLEVR